MFFHRSTFAFLFCLISGFLLKFFSSSFPSFYLRSNGLADPDYYCSLSCAFLAEPYMAAMVFLTSQKNLIFRSNEPILWGYVVSHGFFFFLRDTASTEPFWSPYIASYPSSFLPFSQEASFSLWVSQERVAASAGKPLPPILSPFLFSSSVQLDLRADFTGYRLRECALQRPHVSEPANCCC